MQLIQGTTVFKLTQPSAVAVGKFDGIHRGHKQLLDRIIRKKEDGMQAVVFTFDPSPAVFFGKQPVRSVTTRAEKRRIFERMGIDVLIEFPLTHETASMSPERFVESVLVDKMYTSYVAAGTDVSFGAGGRGDYALLVSLGRRHGFTVEILDKICVDGREISSSFVREELEKGNMERVTELIGAPYSITGTVVHGKRLGRTIGMPTVNLIPDADKLLPPNGVYYSQVSYRGDHYRSISNIGCKPTVSNENVMGVETYLYDFAEDIYGKDIIVNLFSFKRPEMKFSSLEELKSQMQKDIAEGAKWDL